MAISSHTQNMIVIVTLILLVIYCIIMGILMAIALAGQKGCEQTESPLCPSYYCNNLDTQLCKGRAFRYDDKGVEQCQFTGAVTYLHQPTGA